MSQTMVEGKDALGADLRAGIAVVIDDVGPAVLVDGVRHPTTADELEVMGRRALAMAASLRGGLRPPEPVDVEIFRPVWPGRLPVESGVPPELVTDAGLSGCQRFVWFALWLLAPHFTGRMVVRERTSWVARWLTLDAKTVRTAILRLEARGWLTVEWKATPPRGKGEFEAMLHLQRRVGAPDDGAIETTAEPRG